jgi:glycosyltransferase involved in cell wall biosynthesis
MSNIMNNNIEDDVLVDSAVEKDLGETNQEKATVPNLTLAVILDAYKKGMNAPNQNQIVNRVTEIKNSSETKVFYEPRSQQPAVSRALKKLVKEEKCEIIHGVGVDLERFTYSEVKNSNVFLMIARLLKTKGVFEYCEAARIVKQKHPEARFLLVGGESTVKKTDIQKYIDENSIEYIGQVDDVRDYIGNCTVNVLPSYREGFGLVNAEAGAIGRMSITCDTNRTRDTVIDGYNGFLVPVKSVDSLVEKMCWSIENLDNVKKMGFNARKVVEENFDVKKINEKIMGIVEDL